MSNNRILTLYKARFNLLNILGSIGYDTSEYTKFSINEIDAMFTTNQMDMLLVHPDTKKKIYVSHIMLIANTGGVTMQHIIDDLFIIDGVLSKSDTVVFISNTEPNDSLISKLRYWYDHNGIFVVVHNIKRLQFNILNMYRVPTFRVLYEEELKSVMKKYNVDTVAKFPEISRFDPVALAICMRPGEVCQIERPSPTSGTAITYRVCV